MEYNKKDALIKVMQDAETALRASLQKAIATGADADILECFVNALDQLEVASVAVGLDIRTTEARNFEQRMYDRYGVTS